MYDDEGNDSRRAIRLYRRSLSDGKALPAKVRELVAIGILAYRGLDDGCYKHVKRALKLGATKQELLEAIEATIAPGGAPTFGTGIQALIRVEEEEEKGKKEDRHASKRRQAGRGKPSGRE